MRIVVGIAFVMHGQQKLFAGNGGVELVLLLETVALTLAPIGSGALALDNLELLPFERRFQERERAVLIASRG